MFVADRDRVKSFTWDKESGRPVHTLNSNEDTSRAPRAPPNGHIVRAGEGSALCWTLVSSRPGMGPGRGTNVSEQASTAGKSVGVIARMRKRSTAPEVSQVRHFPSAVASPRASSTRTSRRPISLLEKAQTQAIDASHWTWSTEAQSPCATSPTLGRSPSSRPALRTQTSSSLRRAMATSGCTTVAAR